MHQKYLFEKYPDKHRARGRVACFVTENDRDYDLVSLDCEEPLMQPDEIHIGVHGETTKMVWRV